MLMAVGCRENLILPALYSYAKDGVIMFLLASHVDDILWACDPATEHVIDAIKEELKFGASSPSSTNSLSPPSAVPLLCSFSV